jgi:hypothetical protein
LMFDTLTDLSPNIPHATQFCKIYARDWRVMTPDLITSRVKCDI